MGTAFLKVVIDKSQNNYSAYLPDIIGIAVTASSVDELKLRMSVAIDVFIESCKELHGDIPEVLKGEYQLVFD